MQEALDRKLCNLVDIMDYHRAVQRGALPIAVCVKAAVRLCRLAVLTTFPTLGLTGSARDYLNAPIDTWLTF